MEDKQTNVAQFSWYRQETAKVVQFVCQTWDSQNDKLMKFFF